MLMTVTTSNQTLSAIATAAGGVLESRLEQNDLMRFQIQNLGAYDIYVDIATAAAVASGLKVVASGGTVNFTARPEDVNLISDGTNNADVRIASESVRQSN